MPEAEQQSPRNTTAIDACSIWPECGYRFADRGDRRRLRVSEDFLRHFYTRPELEPLEASCDDEHALHAALLRQPLRPVSDAELRALRDPDAIENYRVALGFRDLLLAHETMEAAYLTLVGGRSHRSGPEAGLLANLLSQLIVLHLLAGQNDPYLFRAAEVFFRPQKVSVDEGVLLADSATLARRREPGAVTVLQLLIDEARGAPPTQADGISVLEASNADDYANRSDQFDLALDLGLQSPGARALRKVLELWLGHFYEVEATIEGISAIEERQWTWHIGLDVESNRILNSLYHGETVTDETLALLLSLFRLRIEESGFLDPKMTGKPIYLAMAMDAERNLRLKPQNLLLNLPLAESA